VEGEGGVLRGEAGHDEDGESPRMAMLFLRLEDIRAEEFWCDRRFWRTWKKKTKYYGEVEWRRGLIIRSWMDDLVLERQPPKLDRQTG
jgi:hypothetical protein